MDTIKRRRYGQKSHVFLKSLAITVLCFVMLAAGYFAALAVHSLLS